MHKSKTNVFCVIVTYNAMKWVDKCIQSLRHSLLIPKVVVVDNCSTDETVSYISTEYPEVYIIVNTQNRGFGGANNQGIEYAYKQGCTHVFLLNQDAWVYPDTISNMVQIQDEYSISLVSPVHLNGNGNMMDGEFFSKFTENMNINTMCTDLLRGSDIKCYVTRNSIPAAAWLMSRNTISEIGGFDPIFFHYGEDNNYIQRLIFHKKTIAIIPNSFIHHDRLSHGNIRMYNRQSTLSGLLSVYLDINHHSILSYLSCHIKNVIKFFVYLCSLKFSRCYHITRAYILFIKNYGRLNFSKKNNRKIQPNWLDV